MHCPCYGVYLGPFAQCKVQKQQRVDRYRRPTCTTKGCPNKDKRSAEFKGPFCSLCGKRLRKVKCEQEGEFPNLHPFELQEQLEDRLDCLSRWLPEDSTDDGVHVWVGAGGEYEMPDGQCRDFWIDESSLTLIEVAPTDMEPEMQAFASRHQHDLDQLRAAYGADNVVLKWGLCYTVSS
jgi:hypothetical protein